MTYGSGHSPRTLNCLLLAPLRHSGTGGRNGVPCRHGFCGLPGRRDAADLPAAEYRGRRLCYLAAPSVRRYRLAPAAADHAAFAGDGFSWRPAGPQRAIYFTTTGILLIAPSGLMLFRCKAANDTATVRLLRAMLAGAVAGFLSGVTGVGGGVFLVPQLVLFGWALAKRAAGISAPFILLNSALDHAGSLFAGQQIAQGTSACAIGAIVGAVLGPLSAGAGCRSGPLATSWPPSFCSLEVTSTPVELALSRERTYVPGTNR